MIVVEGPDGSGKTTLIKEIQTQFPVTVAPRVVSKDAEAMVDLVQWVEENNQKLDQGVVYDRHRLISEPIYGPVLRSQTEAGFEDIHWMTAQMRLFYAKKPVLIYCLPPRGIVKANAFSDDDNRVVQGEDGRTLERIYDLYVARAAVDIGTSRAYLYDYTQPGALRGIMGTISREEMF